MKVAPSAPLVGIVEKLIAQEPFEFDGHKWAAKPNAYYCDAAGLSDSTLRRMVRRPPFVARRALVSGLQTCLLRIGEAGPKSVHETAKILRGVWRNKIGMKKPETKEEIDKWEVQKRCLWGYAKDIMALPGLKEFSDPSEFAIDAFKGALDNWQETVTACRLEAEKIPNYVWRYRDYPSIPIMCHFHKAVGFAHVSRLMEKGKIPPGSYKAAGALADLTDPFKGHPGDNKTLQELVDMAAYPAKGLWKPKKYPGALDKPLTLKAKLAAAQANADIEEGEIPF